MTTTLQNIVDATTPVRGWRTIDLPDDVYDDADPLVINRSTIIRGGRGAVVHSEILALDGATFRLAGVTLEMNKVGASQHDGFLLGEFPQNGMITGLKANIFIDDVDMHSLPGFAKTAIFINNSLLHVRSTGVGGQIDWRDNTAPVLELLYGSEANLFAFNALVPMNMYAGTSAANGQAITMAGTRTILSGFNLENHGSAPVGFRVSRNSYIQSGAGNPVSITGFTTPILDDGTRNSVYP